MTLPQLKVFQEVIALAVFAPFAIYYMHPPLRLDYLWASLCIMGAVYLIFRGQGALSKEQGERSEACGNEGRS